MNATALQFLHDRIRALEERVATLEAIAHPPANLQPAIEAAIQPLLDKLDDIATSTAQIAANTPSLH